MPNWCENELTIEGKGAGEAARSLAGENGLLDFATVVPQPEIVTRVQTGGRKFNGEYVTEWYASDGEERPLTDDERAQLSALGVTSWYDWNISNWGTKWNADELQGEPAIEENFAEFSFLTAWSPPTAFAEALSAKFPQLRVTLHYHDPGCGIHGLDTYGPTEAA